MNEFVVVLKIRVDRSDKYDGPEKWDWPNLLDLPAGDDVEVVIVGRTNKAD